MFILNNVIMMWRNSLDRIFNHNFFFFFFPSNSHSLNLSFLLFEKKKSNSRLRISFQKTIKLLSFMKRINNKNESNLLKLFLIHFSCEWKVFFFNSHDIICRIFSHPLNSKHIKKLFSSLFKIKGCVTLNSLTFFSSSFLRKSFWAVSKVEKSLLFQFFLKENFLIVEEKSATLHKTLSNERFFFFGTLHNKI